MPKTLPLLYRPEEMIIRYGPPKRLKYLMLGRESRRNEGRTRWREGFGPAGVFYGPPVASSARELFMLGGSWGYGPAVIFYGPSRLPAPTSLMRREAQERVRRLGEI